MSAIAVDGVGTVERRARVRPRDWVFIVLVGGFLLLVLAWAIVPQLFTGYDPTVGDFTQKLQPPSVEHPFGTDYLGRDLLARVVYGTRLTLLAAFVAVLVGVAIGSLLGLASGTLPAWADAIIMRFIDVLLSVPALLLSLCLLAVVGAGIWVVSIAVGIGSIALFSRFVRSQVLRLRPELFVRAARVSGAGHSSVLVRHIIPNLWVPLTALVIVEIGQAVISISVLGFLGYGAPPPTPEWGRILAEGRQYLNTAWWITTLPGIVLVVTVALLSFVQGWLVDLTNPERKR